MFIPESLLEKEKDHVEGFAPEVAWVTHGGLEPLQERMCVRPTSETLFCDLYSRDVHSHRDLPKIYNQWCSCLLYTSLHGSHHFLNHIQHFSSHLLRFLIGIGQRVAFDSIVKFDLRFCA